LGRLVSIAIRHKLIPSFMQVALPERRGMKTFRLLATQYRSLVLPQSISFAVLCATVLWLLAMTTAIAQEVVQRDPQALTILTQTIAAGGGLETLASIQDLTETGTVTYNWAGPVTGTVTVKSRGLHQFKIDADLPKGRQTAVVSGEGGSLKRVDGQTLPIYRQSADDLGSLTLPCLSLIAAMQDNSIRIVYLGLVTHDGTPAYDIRLIKVYSKEQDPTGSRGEQEERDFYIAPQTFFVVAISDQMHYRGRDDKGVPHENLYSNYQSENGIMVPLTVVETIHGVTGTTMTLSQITFNSGLADSDFSW
jgi:hypothetical protein